MLDINIAANAIIIILNRKVNYASLLLLIAYHYKL